MKRILAVCFIVAGSVASSQAAYPVTSYVQVNPPNAPQAGGFNTQSGTVGTFTDTGLAPNQCVQTTTGGLLTTSGAQCGSAGGGGGASTLETMVNTVHLSSPTPTINVIGQGVTGTLVGSTATFTLPFAQVATDTTTIGNNYLTKSSATATYLQQTPAANTYLTQSSATLTYLQTIPAIQTYLQLSSATATYLQNSSAAITYIQVSTTLAVAHGGTGTASPALTPGTNMGSFNGTWPNLTINAASTLASIPNSVLNGHCAEFISGTSIGDAGAPCGSGGSVTLISSGVAFGSSLNAVTQDTNTFTYNASAGLLSLAYGVTAGTFTATSYSSAPVVYAQTLSNYPNSSMVFQLNNSFGVDTAMTLSDGLTGNILNFNSSNTGAPTLQGVTGISDTQGNKLSFNPANISAGGDFNLNGSTNAAKLFTVSTNTAGPYFLAISTNGNVSASSVTVQNITINGTCTGSGCGSGGGLVSLSTGVIGILPATNMVSTAAFTSVTNTFTSSNTFSGQVNISTSIQLSGSAGTNGQVLTSGGANTIPTWTTVSGGGGGSGQLIYPATGTASFPYGSSFSTIAVVGLTVSSQTSTLGSGVDTIFSTMSDCSFKLNWDTETVGGFRAWVNLPTVSASVDTNFYICYGSSTLTTYQGVSTGTWDAFYQGVYHFPDGTTLNPNDSTSHAINLTGTASPTAGTGEVDGAMVLNGTSQYEQSASAANCNLTSSGTVEGWVKMNALTTSNSLVGKNAQATDRNGYAFQVQSSGKLFLELASGSANIGGLTTSAITAGGWHHIAMTWNNATIKAFIDGTQDATTFSQTLTPVSNVWPLVIGASGEQLYNFFGGTIDEVRLSSTARSADWIKTEYNNITNPSGFISTSAEGAGGSGFTYKRTLTINHALVSNTDQTNFPVYFSGITSTPGTLTLPAITNSILATNASGVVVSTSVTVYQSSGTQTLIQMADGRGGFQSLPGVYVSSTENAGANTLGVNAPTGNNSFFMPHVGGGAWALDVQANSTGTANGDLTGSLYISQSALNLFARQGQPAFVDATGDSHIGTGPAGPIQLRSSASNMEATPYTGLQINATQQALVPSAAANCDLFSGRVCPMVDGVTRLEVDGKVFISSNTVLPGTTFYQSGVVQMGSKSNAYVQISSNAIIANTTFYQGGLVTIGNTATAAASNDFLVQIASANATPIFQINNNGHVISSGTVPTVASCGVSPSVDNNSTDFAGIINVGSGVTTSCTLTFASAFVNSPVCILSDDSTTVSGDVSSRSTTAVIFSFSATLGSGHIFYVCVGAKG